MSRGQKPDGDTLDEVLLATPQQVDFAEVNPDDELIFLQNYAYVCPLIFVGNVALVCR